MNANRSDSKKLIGRTFEKERILKQYALRRNLMVEGPVGCGKTYLIQTIFNNLGVPIARVDGDGRYTEQKLVGSFDPVKLLKLGYVPEAFENGPLLLAMNSGVPLFVNEINRMPESVQNVLLTAMDEKRIFVPHLGEVFAKDGFVVFATQNPKEFAATSYLSEALLDRFDSMAISYPPFIDEVEILTSKGISLSLAKIAVSVTQMSREDGRVCRGASLRAAEAMVALLPTDDKEPSREDWITAAVPAFRTRIEILAASTSPNEREKTIESLLTSWVDSAIKGEFSNTHTNADDEALKKKS